MLARPDREPQRVAEIPTEAQYIDAGYLVFGRSGALLAQRFDTASGRLAGDPVPLASKVRLFGASGWGGFSASRSGTIAFVSSRRPDASRVDGRGGQGGRARRRRRQLPRPAPDSRRPERTHVPPRCRFWRVRHLVDRSRQGHRGTRDLWPEHEHCPNRAGGWQVDDLLQVDRRRAGAGPSGHRQRRRGAARAGRGVSAGRVDHEGRPDARLPAARRPGQLGHLDAVARGRAHAGAAHRDIVQREPTRGCRPTIACWLSSQTIPVARRSTSRPSRRRRRSIGSPQREAACRAGRPTAR